MNSILHRLEICILSCQKLLEQDLPRTRRLLNARAQPEHELATLRELAGSVLHHLRRADVECVVVGITKAGKSTLLNALLGAEVLPTTSVPATCRNLRIRHVANRTEPCLIQDGQVLQQGVEAVRAALASMQNAVRSNDAVAAPDGLVVEAALPLGDFAEVEGRYRLVFLDTPGVTEADGGPLQRETLAALQEADVVVVVFNHAELRTSGELEFLSKAVRERPDLFLQPGRHFFCVLAKLDLANRNSLAVSDLAALIRQQINEALPEGMPERYTFVWPIQGELALLARLVSSDQANTEQIADYKRRLFGRVGERRVLPSGQLKAMGRKSLRLSRVPLLECKLNRDLLQRLPTVRLRAVRGRLLTLLYRVRSVFEGLDWRRYKEANKAIRELKSAPLDDLSEEWA